MPVSLAPNSTCDICYDSYDEGSKKPCTTACGHIFCLDCLCNVLKDRQPKCPLCRSEVNTSTELHLDAGDVQRLFSHAQPPSQNQPSTNREAKAQRLLNDIDHVLDRPATFLTHEDEEVQRLISRCQIFLQSHHPEQFQGLLTSFHLFLRILSLSEELESQRQIAILLQTDLSANMSPRDGAEWPVNQNFGQPDSDGDQMTQQHESRDDRLGGRNRRWRYNLPGFGDLVRRRDWNTIAPFGLYDGRPEIDDPSVVIASLHSISSPLHGRFIHCPYCRFTHPEGHWACPCTSSYNSSSSLSTFQ
ncbi:hypothetical protein K435DRAFT_971708 [Dendrothele bispora CBS 962.96]|uniref:RING-type domain-containing protein n=1 Tax=Dendrothele bispora (strain CBS 962.96) TaxID=1314807 RepID=A0A4S8L3R0_DENBC|nr:hypothetical protein K435DRAFT_971708 [Dendrothele bispora CBS 962.96]